MSDQEGTSGNVLQEAIIALRYKIENKQAYKEFSAAMKNLGGGSGDNKKIGVNVGVRVSGLQQIRNIRKEIEKISGRVNINLGANASSALNRQPSQGGAQEHRRKIPITWPSRESPSVSATNNNNRSASAALHGGIVITTDQIRELGSAARAASEAVRSSAQRIASSLSASQQGMASRMASSHLPGSRGIFDPYAADQNLDRAHDAGSFSSLKFHRAAPDMSRMMFSPAGGSHSVHGWQVPRPDMTVFKRGIESLRRWAANAGRQMQSSLNVTPQIGLPRGAGTLRDAMATVGVGGLLTGFGSLLNESQQISDQIKNLTPGIENAEKAQQGLLEAAKQTNTSFKGTVDIYSSLAAISDRTKLSAEQNVGIAKTIQMASQLGGGTAEGQKRAIIQLEQALQMGKMDGQGINSIESQSRGLAIVVAEGMGKSMADLKQMTKEGKLTSDEIIKAFAKMGPEVEKRFGKVRVTFGGLMNYTRTVMLGWASKLTKAWDGWGRGIKFVRDSVAALDSFLSSAFHKISGVLGGAENAAKLVQYAFLSLGGGAVIAAVWAFGGAVLAALWPVVAAAGAVFAAIIAIDDIFGWIAGKKSVMGDLVGPFEKFKPTFDKISESFSELGKAWNSLWGGSDGMKDALDTDGEPPLAKSFKSILEDVKGLIENVKELLRLLKALQDGDYGSALNIGSSAIQNGLTPGGDAKGMSWGESLRYTMSGKDPYKDPALGWYWKATDWATGAQTLPIDQRLAQLREQNAGASSNVTTNNSPNITVYAGSSDPEEIANHTVSAITKTLNKPMLPNAERGPR